MTDPGSSIAFGLLTNAISAKVHDAREARKTALEEARHFCSASRQHAVDLDLDEGRVKESLQHAPIRSALLVRDELSAEPVLFALLSPGAAVDDRLVTFGALADVFCNSVATSEELTIAALYSKQRADHVEVLSAIDRSRWTGDRPVPYKEVLARLQQEHPVCRNRRSEIGELRDALTLSDHRPILVTGRPWSGKTNLLVHVATKWRRLNGKNLRTFSVFVRSGRGATSTSEILYRMNSQLILDLGSGDGVPESVDRLGDQLRDLASLAAQSMVEADEVGLLILDGLDEAEDPGALIRILDEIGEPALRIVIGSRYDEAELQRLGLHHGASTNVEIRPLAELARDVERDRVELTALLASSPNADRLVATLAASGSTLTGSDLSDVLGLPPYQIADLAGRLARHVGEFPASEGKSRFGFRHVETYRACVSLVGDRMVSAARQAILDWADTYRARGWPADSPSYLIDELYRCLAGVTDVDVLDAWLTVGRFSAAVGRPNAASGLVLELRAFQHRVGLLPHERRAEFYASYLLKRYASGFARHIPDDSWAGMSEGFGAAFAYSLWILGQDSGLSVDQLIGIARGASGENREVLLRQSLAMFRRRTGDGWWTSAVQLVDACSGDDRAGGIRAQLSVLAVVSPNGSEREEVIETALELCASNPGSDARLVLPPWSELVGDLDDEDGLLSQQAVLAAAIRRIEPDLAERTARGLVDRSRAELHLFQGDEMGDSVARTHVEVLRWAFEVLRDERLAREALEAASSIEEPWFRTEAAAALTAIAFSAHEDAPAVASELISASIGILRTEERAPAHLRIEGAISLGRAATAASDGEAKEIAADLLFHELNGVIWHALWGAQMVVALARIEWSSGVVRSVEAERKLVDAVELVVGEHARMMQLARLCGALTTEEAVDRVLGSINDAAAAAQADAHRLAEVYSEVAISLMDIHRPDDAERFLGRAEAADKQASYLPFHGWSVSAVVVARVGCGQATRDDVIAEFSGGRGPAGRLHLPRAVRAMAMIDPVEGETLCRDLLGDDLRVDGLRWVLEAAATRDPPLARRLLDELLDEPLFRIQIPIIEAAGRLGGTPAVERLRSTIGHQDRP